MEHADWRIVQAFFSEGGGEGDDVPVRDRGYIKYSIL